MLPKRRVLDLLQVISSQSCKCPAHGNPGVTTRHELRNVQSTVANATPTKEYAFEACIFKIKKSLIVYETNFDINQIIVNYKEHFN
ncbi:hypothetical protein WH47_01645 [Habropoda laboriosa]|uniref:Uncharacterized protein n=1 Tax=Habropoda laboriosa TaxID=597456 RepID=A0A0L7R3Z6_9HYME|nr:hypothetical protein WH47_01645 [Habropoda laboriosa]